MYVFTRAQIRSFRAVLRRSKIGKQSAGNAPLLVVVASGDRYALQATSESVAIELSISATCPSGRIVLPLDVLQVCEGHSEDPVTIRRMGNDRINVEWIDQRIPQVREYDPLPADDQPSFPALPTELRTNQPGFWSALRDAIGSAERVRTRYALDCLQLRGQTGQIVATDGQQALAQSGFTFPWANDILIPALDVLGCRELPQDVPVAIGRGVDWVTLVIGAWTIAVKVENDAHFPKIDTVIPSTASTRSRLNLTNEDARFLMAALPKLPSEDECHWPVTVELNGHVAIRGKAPDNSRPTELILSHSRLHGEPVRWQTNRKLLARAVRLGFRDVCLTDPESPAMCDDGQRQFVWAVLNPKCAIPPQTDAVRIESPATRELIANRKAPRSPSRDNSVTGAVSITGSKLTPAAENVSADTTPITSLIHDAEALRTSLRDLLGKTNVLVMGLKRQRKQSRLK
ncbi:MAG: hypothetical protein JWN70_825, partial [Planctomycetaceae bacterium]|nr:hypothetical protein [Planctomycetaceae bacterium]